MFGLRIQFLGELNIGSTPALLIGEKSEKVFLFVHGLHGNKEEALAFAEVAVPKGYQVLGISRLHLFSEDTPANKRYAADEFVQERREGEDRDGKNQVHGHRR